MQIQYGILQINQHDTECFKFSVGYEDANPELRSKELNARVQAHVEYAASISMRLGDDEDDVGRSTAWQRRGRRTPMGLQLSMLPSEDNVSQPQVELAAEQQQEHGRQGSRSSAPGTPIKTQARVLDHTPIPGIFPVIGFYCFLSCIDVLSILTLRLASRMLAIDTESDKVPCITTDNNEGAQNRSLASVNFLFDYMFMSCTIASNTGTSTYFFRPVVQNRKGKI